MQTRQARSFVLRFFPFDGIHGTQSEHADRWLRVG
jgi:hypothetical protein